MSSCTRRFPPKLVSILKLNKFYINICSFTYSTIYCNLDLRRGKLKIAREFFRMWAVDQSCDLMPSTLQHGLECGPLAVLAVLEQMLRPEALPSVDAGIFETYKYLNIFFND